MSVIYKMNKPKSTVSAMRLKSVSADETETSTAYVVAKDDEGNIEELRSLPNGTKDEIRVSEGKLIKRVSDWVTLDGSESWDLQSINEYGIANFRLSSTIDVLPNIKPGAGSVSLFPARFPEQNTFIADTTTEGFYLNNVPVFFIRIFANTLNTPDVVGFKSYLSQNPIRLIYQLATPIEIPIQTSGSLVSYPSGTVYIEPYVADAGIYTDKMSVLHQDLPIKAIEKLSKVDFITGLETELDVSETVIAGDKLSFTHPDLEAGDIVFFVYEHDQESTEGETEIEYYDSRYVVKDDVTEKFYKWNVKVSNGTPTIEVVEV